jgi:ABC-type uncharacterized transport system permease subunit
MKNLSWFNKGMYSLNILLIIVTFIAYILPFLALKYFPILSVLTLITFVFHIEWLVFLSTGCLKTNDFIWNRAF